MPALSPEYEATQLVALPRTPPPGHRPVRLVSGSTPGLTAETDHLLAVRLRNIALILSAGFLVVLFTTLFEIDGLASKWRHAQWWTLLGVTAFMLLMSWRLCIRCPHTLKHLRLTEFLIIAPTTLLFAFNTIIQQLESTPLGFLLSPVHPWILLTLIYALYIPNTWRRAGVIVATIAAIGIFSSWAPTLFNPSVAKLLEEQPVLELMLVHHTLAIVFSAVAATWGVRTMGALREQAYEAQRIGQYKLKRLLGRGGMGEVHLAEHLMLRRPCAIKLISPAKAGDPEALARFEREVQATARLTHWNTVEIYDYGRTEDGVFYYVMEYLPGLNLQQIVERGGPLPPERVIHLLTQTADALAEAHCRGMVHRDIKPANIFAASRGGVDDVVKLLDFGLVRDQRSQTEELGVTQAGVITGSPLFMSPEQASGETPDARSDIYSLGITGYYLLTGRVPFESDKPIKVIMAHVQQPVPPMSTFGVTVPPDLEAVIQRCLEKDPTRRFQSAGKLQAALKLCDDADAWTREMAADWWHTRGCPDKRKLDVEVCEMEAVC
jgi:hypothetical protein